MKTEIHNLSLHDFTFALLGQDTEHYRTDVDLMLDGIHIERVDVIQYLRECIGDEDIEILKAIKADMLQAFDEFFGWYTSVATQDSVKGTVSGYTVPKSIVWVNKKGRKMDLYISDDQYEILDVSSMEEFDYLPLIDEHRINIGLPPLKGLDFYTYSRAVYMGKRDLIQRLQKQHFEQHTLYAVAMDYINSQIKKIHIFDAPNNTNNPITKDFNEDKSDSKEDSTPFTDTPEILRNKLNGSKGRDTALIIKAAIGLGWLSQKPKFTDLKKIGVTGNADGYNRYFRDQYVLNITKKEVEEMMNYLEQNQ